MASSSSSFSPAIQNPVASNSNSNSNSSLSLSFMLKIPSDSNARIACRRGHKSSACRATSTLTTTSLSLWSSSTAWLLAGDRAKGCELQPSLRVVAAATVDLEVAHFVRSSRPPPPPARPRPTNSHRVAGCSTVAAAVCPSG